MNFGFSGDLIFLAFLGLVLFGPRELPQVVKTVGRLVAELKRASGEFHGQLSREIGDPEPSQSAKTLSSLADRIMAVNAAGNPAKAIRALTEPTQLKQQLSQVSLMDNVNRIKDFLAKNGAATEAHDAEQPSQPVAHD